MRVADSFDYKVIISEMLRCVGNAQNQKPKLEKLEKSRSFLPSSFRKQR